MEGVSECFQITHLQHISTVRFQSQFVPVARTQTKGSICSWLIKFWLWHFRCRGVWRSLCIASTNAHDQKHSGTKLKHDSASFENVDDFSIWWYEYAWFQCSKNLRCLAHPKGTVSQVVPRGPELAWPLTQRWLFPGVESEGRQPTGPQELQSFN